MIKNIIKTIVLVIICIAFIIIGFIKGISLTENQASALKILIIVCLSSVAYCFIVGEISRNNSQMDKLWSILPIIYTIIIMIIGNFNFRLVIMAILTCLWGIRLTYNFGRKGAYKLKFWEGEEDYRWLILRKKRIFKSKIMWAAFDLLFISMYQNFLVLAMCLPGVACIDSAKPINAIDIIAILFTILFLLIETIADEQQWKFHKKKKELLSSGLKLDEIEAPYNKGFNTTGLWGYSRHPNYLGEQGMWLSFYIFVIAGASTHFGIFNWSIFGSMLIVLLFLGSSTFSESVSKSKYPEYSRYQEKVSKYIPFKKYE